MYNFQLPPPDGSLKGQEGVLWVRGEKRFFTFGDNNEFISGDAIIHRPYAWMILVNPEQLTKPDGEFLTYNAWLARGRCVMKGQKSTRKINGQAVFSIGQTKLIESRAMSPIDNIGTKPAIMRQHDHSPDREHANRGVGEVDPTGIDGASGPVDPTEPSPFNDDGYGA